MDFDNYDLDPAIYDEMFLQDGTPREHCEQLYETLTRSSAEELNSIQERVARSFSNEGITFTVYGADEADERIIPVDSIPRVMSAPDWREIETGLTQRLRALNLFLEDVFGPSRSNDRYGMLIGPHSTPEEREEYAKQVRANPPEFISQPVLDLSRSPCLIDGRFKPRYVDLRPFVLHGRKTRIVPGAFCRVALRRGSLVVNSSQGGGGKDFWVLGE